MRNSKTIILIIAILISLVGIFSIYSSTYQREGRFWQAIYKRQIIWLSIGLVIFALLSNLNYRRLWDGAYFLYIFSLFLLLLVFLLGVVRLGAQRWLKVIWLNFQPSEFTKLVMVLFFARYFSRKSIDEISLPLGRCGIIPGLIKPLAFLIIPMGLIMEQPDLGSSLMLFFVFIGLIYLGGVRLRYLGLFLSGLLLMLPLFWKFLRSYQRERLLVFLNPNIDPLGAGYTIIQSKIAIGSGGLFGRGWLAGTQSQLRFLPEAHTDFIFATFAEQWGLMGAIVLLCLYYLLIREGFLIAKRSGDYFAKLLASGISLMFLFQVFTNVAMNLGIAPVVGLPLPLMSYGGSSVFMTFIALGILVSIDKRRAVF